MRRSGSLEIVIDDGTHVGHGEEAWGCCADWEVLDGLGGDASAAPATYGAQLSNGVHSPSSPNPFWIKPLPPDGPPPPLLSNKRGHGYCTAPGSSPSPSAAVSANLDAEGQIVAGYPSTTSHTNSFSTNVDADMAMASSASSSWQQHQERQPSSATSPSSASSSCDSEHREPSPEFCEEEMLAAPILAAAPEMPPGPPPARLAPPPPDGPPPDLPLDRVELKRGVEDPANSPVGKRLRSTSIPSIYDDSGADGRGSGDKPSQPGCSTDGESSTSTSDVEEEGQDTDLSGAKSWRSAHEAGGIEASYAQSPPSVRWVWDRILQQDRQPANTNVLEKRMLQALDALHFGAEDSTEPD